MCDYSLMNIPNRLARDGEELVTHRFQTGSIGLASPSDLSPYPNPLGPRTFWSKVKHFFCLPEPNAVAAVCIPPGATLELIGIPIKWQREFGIGTIEEVTFTQLTPAANTYRDAVRFSDGREIILQRFREGQCVRVLRLGPTDDGDSGTPINALNRTSSDGMGELVSSGEE